MVVVLVVAAFVVGAVVIARSPLLDVDRVEVRGTRQVDPAAVRSAAVPLGRPMVSVDEDAVARRLEALPWVASAQVVRRWPSTVVVTVRERVPVAVVRTGGRNGSPAQLVDADGVVLGPASSRVADGLPTVLVGRAPEPGTTVSDRARQIVAAVHGLDPALRRQVARGTSRADSLRLVLDDDVTVVLGDASRLAAKSDAVLALLDQADRDSIDTIDVSVPGSAALTRHDGPGA